MNPPKDSLQELPEDNRDVLGQIITLPKVENLPANFSLGEQPVKNQDDLMPGSDFCTQYAACLASQYQEKVELLPEYTFAWAKRDNPEVWGDNLRSACKAQQRLGAVSISETVAIIKDIDSDKLRYFDSYPEYLKDMAKGHKKKSYIKLRNFDEIRSMLFKYKDRAVIMGLIWSWNLSEYLLTGMDDNGFGHAVCAVGWKTVGGEIHLEIQNSYGEWAGDKGRHLLPRETVNHFVGRYGAFAFIDEKPEVARELQRRATWYNATLLEKLRIKLSEFYNLKKIWRIGLGS